MKPCGSNWIKIKGAQLNINLHSPIVHWMLINNGKRTTMIRCILTELLKCKVQEKCLCLLMWALFLELWVAITLPGSIRSPWFFGNFWSAFNAPSVCVSWFLIELLQFLPNLDYVVSHGLNPLGLIYISKATRNWHIQYWFCHCRRNVASFKCKNNFLTRGCNRSSRKVFGSSK